MSRTCIPFSTCWIVHSTYARHNHGYAWFVFQATVTEAWPWFIIASRRFPRIDLWKFRPGIRGRKHDVSSETWPSYRSADPGMSKLLVSRCLFDRDSDVNVFQIRSRAIRRLEYRKSTTVTVDLLKFTGDVFAIAIILTGNIISANTWASCRKWNPVKKSRRRIFMSYVRQKKQVRCWGFAYKRSEIFYIGGR